MTGDLDDYALYVSSGCIFVTDIFSSSVRISPSSECEYISRSFSTTIVGDSSKKVNNICWFFNKQWGEWKSDSHESWLFSSFSRLSLWLWWIRDTFGKSSPHKCDKITHTLTFHDPRQHSSAAWVFRERKKNKLFPSLGNSKLLLFFFHSSFSARLLRVQLSPVKFVDLFFMVSWLYEWQSAWVMEFLRLCLPLPYVCFMWKSRYRTADLLDSFARYSLQKQETRSIKRKKCVSVELG